MVEIVAGGIVIVVAAIYLKIQEREREIEDYQKVIKKYIKKYINNYPFEECDKSMIESCRLYIATRFSGNFHAEFDSCQSLAEREQLVQTVAQELITRMGLRVDEVQFVDLGPYTYGKGGMDNTGKNVVRLNEKLILTDPKQLIKTLCHELRHCVQIQSITDNVWGYSDQRVALWLANYGDYPDSDECMFLAYKLQPIELDANAFAEAIIPN